MHPQIDAEAVMWIGGCVRGRLVAVAETAGQEVNVRAQAAETVARAAE